MTRWISRQIWFWMLWSIRRPSSRKLQRAALNLIPERHRDFAHKKAIAQEKFARRIGLRLITFVVNFFFVSVALTGILMAILHATAAGWIVIPTRESLNLDLPPK